MSSPIRLPALAAAILLLAAPVAWPQGKAKSAPEDQTGLKAGEQAPKFSLKDQEGRERSLDEFLTSGKVALVFYRSADW
jgi:cytochrome oxidase Cu insertion factor (SCO1/SenC/PrrC family)